jgi:hypothetical protein
MTTTISTHQAIELKFDASRYSDSAMVGGYLRVLVVCELANVTTYVKVGCSSLCRNEVEFVIHTSNLALVDHFIDIIRVVNGPIGSLSPKPKEALADGDPAES